MWILREKMNRIKKIFACFFILSLILFASFIIFSIESYYYSAPLHIALLSVSMYFIWDKDLRTTLKKLGIPGNLKTNVIYTIGGFVALLATLALLLGVLGLLGIENDSEMVGEVIRGLPWFIPLFAVIVAPITEELFFRAFLVPRVGVIGSSLLFGISHVAYGSTVEILGAFFVAIVFATMYKGSKSIIPPILVHFAYNLVSIIVILAW